jgi:hypothetical protein
MKTKEESNQAFARLIRLTGMYVKGSSRKELTSAGASRMASIERGEASLAVKGGWPKLHPRGWSYRNRVRRQTFTSAVPCCEHLPCDFSLDIHLAATTSTPSEPLHET